MKLSPDQKLDIREVLKDLAFYRPKRKGWTWRQPITDQQVGPFILKDTSKNLTNSVPLPAGCGGHDRNCFRPLRR
jgi:D-ornithine 4,5-aminomutase subunit beta